MTQQKPLLALLMYSYAQTNIQLFNQLQEAGYEHADLACVL